MNQTDEPLSLFGGLARHHGLTTQQVAAETGLSLPTVADLVRGNRAKRQTRILAAVASWLCTRFDLGGSVDVNVAAEACATIPSTPERLERAVAEFLTSHQRKKARAAR